MPLGRPGPTSVRVADVCPSTVTQFAFLPFLPFLRRVLNTEPLGSCSWEDKTRSVITPRRASATPPLRTGADMCRTGSGAGKRSGAKSYPVRRRSSHAWTEDQAGRRIHANIDAVGGWRVHTADNTRSRNAATRSKHCHFMFRGDRRPRAAAGSSRNGTTQAVAATTNVIRLESTHIEHPCAATYTRL